MDQYLQYRCRSGSTGTYNCEMVGQGPVLVIYGMYRYDRDQCLWCRVCTGMAGTSSINLGDMR